MNAPLSYTLHLHPPAYPEKCRPFRCQHEPQFLMQAEVHIVPRKRGGNSIEIDHAVCLACGKPMPCTIGGNVLVDLTMLLGRFGWHAQIGGRIHELRAKWSRIATYLFGPKGWNGRHERIARLIDPDLTMKLKLQRISGQPRRVTRDTVRMGVITFDRSRGAAMTHKLTTALQQIAHGRTDCGRPLAGETARQLARDTLSAAGIDWSRDALRDVPPASRVPLQQRPGYRAEPGHPITRDLRDLSDEHELSGAVLITFGAGRVGVDSTGRTEEFALVMRKLGERVMLAIDDGEYDPAKLLRGAAN